MADLTTSISIVATDESSPAFQKATAAAAQFAATVQADAVPAATLLSRSLETVPATAAGAGAALAKLSAQAMEAFSAVKISSSGATQSLREFGAESKIAAGQFSFAALGAAFGGGLIGAYFETVVDKARETVIEFGHLAAASGTEVGSLVQLKDEMNRLGATHTDLDRIVMRLAYSMNRAATDGSATEAVALRALGVEVDRLASGQLTWLDVQEQIARHLATSANQERDLANLREVAGRNVVEYAAFLREEGSQLAFNTSRFREHGEAVRQSEAAAKALQSEEAILSAEFKTIAVEALPYVVTGLHAAELAGRALMEAFEDTVLKIGTPLMEAADYAIAAGKAINAAAHGDFKAAHDAMAEGARRAAETERISLQTLQAEADKTTKALAAMYQEKITGAEPRKAPRGAMGEEDLKKHRDIALETSMVELAGEEAHQLAMVDAEKRGVELMQRLRDISETEAADRLQAANAHKLAIEQGFIAQRIALLSGEPDNAPKIAEQKGREIAARDKAAAEAQAIEGKLAESALRRVEDQKRASELSIAADLQHSTRRLEIERSHATAQEAIRRISMDQLLVLERRIDAEEEALQRTSIAKRLALIKDGDAGAAASRQRLNDELQALDDKAAARKQKEVDDAAKREQQIAVDAVRAQSIRIDGDRRAQEARIAQELDAARFQEATRQISAEQRLAIEQRLYADEEEIQRKAIEEEAANLDKSALDYASKYAALMEKLGRLDDERNARMQRGTEEALAKQIAAYNRFFDRIGGEFDNSFRRWAAGEETFSRSFGQMEANIYSTFVGTLEHMGTQWALMELRRHVLHQRGVMDEQALETKNLIFHQHVLTTKQIAEQVNASRKIILDQGVAAEEESSVAAAAATKGGIEATEATKSVSRSAASAAGKAYSAMAEIPIVGPALGAAAAAATFAAVMAFETLISAQGGADLGAGGPYATVLHSREMVLPAPLAEGVRSMVAAGGAGQSGPGGSSEQHLHYHAAQGETPQSINRNLDAFNRAIRDGRLKLRFP